MRTSPQNVISCLSGDFMADHHLIIEAIREDETLLALFRDAVKDFTEYAPLRDAINGVI
jgi:p-aminobenzoyl-glutamate transporter AbgT